MRQVIFGIVALFATTVALVAETPNSFPSFHIEPGDAVKAEVRLNVAAKTHLYMLLTADKSRKYIEFVRTHVDRRTRIYVCGELLAEATLPKCYATSDCTFSVSPQQGLDLAFKLVTEPGSKRSKYQ